MLYLFHLQIYRRFIKWHSIRQWNQFLDTFPSFPKAVGSIEGTIHQIGRPSGPLQAEFYRGGKRCHFISVVHRTYLWTLMVPVLSSFSSQGIVLIICFDQSLFFCMDNHHYCTLQVSRTHKWCPMLPESSSDWTWQSQRSAPSSMHSGWGRLRCESACYNSDGSRKIVDSCMQIGLSIHWECKLITLLDFRKSFFFLCLQLKRKHSTIRKRNGVFQDGGRRRCIGVVVLSLSWSSSNKT